MEGRLVVDPSEFLEEQWLLWILRRLEAWHRVAVGLRPNERKSFLLLRAEEEVNHPLNIEVHGGAPDGNVKVVQKKLQKFRCVRSDIHEVPALLEIVWTIGWAFNASRITLSWSTKDKNAIHIKDNEAQ